jgi:hypothetical protein
MSMTGSYHIATGGLGKSNVQQLIHLLSLPMQHHMALVAKARPGMRNLSNAYRRAD